MLDLDLFKHLEEWSSVGDVLASVDWHEIPGPDERYAVSLVWRFRGDYIGEGQYVIELIGDSYRLFWIGLVFIPEWQNKDIYTSLVKSYSQRLLSYNITGVVALPWNPQAEARLASQGFKWQGTEFVLDFNEAQS